MQADLAVLIEAARCARGAQQYEQVLFELLQRRIGFDVGFCIRADGLGPCTPGLAEAVRRDTRGRFGEFKRSVGPMTRAALGDRGVIVDAEFFGARGLERKPHYQAMMRPHRGRSSLLGYLCGPHGPIANLVLGRTTPRFLEREKRFVERAIPVLSLCERVVQSVEPRPMLATLTARERDVLGYLQLGYTNREIASACGTSPRTVRNQLGAIFEKLGASTRAEAVALSLGHHPTR
jgi:DNA-binding CsgD family transcriptional regulator